MQETDACLYIMVIGFHHKKGCQVEYCYPETLERDKETLTYRLPSQWKHLPSLALPDGSHNYQEDYVYFHLNTEDSSETLFGISCFRQINAKDLDYEDIEITRTTVQKSVCLVSKVPLYGSMRIKLASITQAYFEQKNFTKTKILVDGFKMLNSSYNSYEVSEYEVDICLSDLVLKYGHKVLILFKLLLLDKKVLYYMQPPSQLSSTLISLISLLPDIFNGNLLQQSSISLSLNDDCQVSMNETFVEKPLESSPFVNISVKSLNVSKDRSLVISKRDDNDLNELGSDNSFNHDFTRSKLSISNDSHDDNNNKSTVVSMQATKSKPHSTQETSSLDLLTIDYGYPLHIFSQSSFFHPYVSLYYLEYLTYSLVKSFTIGASNILFKNRLQYSLDVLVDNDQIELLNDRTKKQLQLTTADLRFSDYILKHVKTYKQDSSLFEGSDDWIRLHFKWYLSALLASLLNFEDGSCSLDDDFASETSLSSTASATNKNYLLEDFNHHFCVQFSQTEAYKQWSHENKTRLEVKLSKLDDTKGYHPFNGHLNVNDFKLKIMHSFSGTENGRKINKALVEGGKIMTNASKSMYSSLTQAKTRLSSFFNTIQSKSNLLNILK